MNMHRINANIFADLKHLLVMTEPEKNTGLKNRFEVKKPVKNQFGFLNRFTALTISIQTHFPCLFVT